MASTAGDTEPSLSAKLTLSVVSHGHGPLVDRLLTQLSGQASLARTRVVVTLNKAGESIDPSRFPDLELVVLNNDRPRGFGSNHNAAFRLCQTPWFAILNPDLALAGSEPFTRLLEVARRDEHPGVIAPQILGPSGAVEDSVRANLTPWSLASRVMLGRRAPIYVKGPAQKGAPFFWVAGMCLVTSSAAFRAVGGFDERFFLYCEDYDLCCRLYQHGFAIRVDPEARIVHDAQRDSHRSLRHLRWHVSSLLKVWSSSAFWQVTYPQSRSRE